MRPYTHVSSAEWPPAQKNGLTVQSQQQASIKRNISVSAQHALIVKPDVTVWTHDCQSFAEKDFIHNRGWWSHLSMFVLHV